MLGLCPYFTDRGVGPGWVGAPEGCPALPRAPFLRGSCVVSWRNPPGVNLKPPWEKANTFKLNSWLFQTVLNSDEGWLPCVLSWTQLFNKPFLSYAYLIVTYKCGSRGVTGLWVENTFSILSWPCELGVLPASVYRVPAAHVQEQDLRRCPEVASPLGGGRAQQ